MAALSSVLVCSLASVFLMSCYCSKKTCPEGEVLVARGFGAQCEKSSSPATPSTSNIGNVSISKLAIQDACSLNQTVGLYNNNDFAVVVTVLAQPVPPDWAKAERSFDVAARTGVDAPMLIGKEKYPSKIIQGFCDSYNYRLTQIVRK